MMKHYYICYDIGYGERGIKEECLTDLEVKKWITSNFNSKVADVWFCDSPNRYQISDDIVILSEFEFDEKDWVSSGEGT